MLTASILSPLCRHLSIAGLLAACVPAVAQTPPAPASAPDAGTQEVMVTANKIRSFASKTSIALSVVGGDALKSEGVVDARALQDLSPSVQIGQETGRLQINIRGVMSIDNTEKGDPSTAFHIDGMYVGRPESQFSSFLDVERIEVLRGPQGTLYGRNATGGAINVISNKPGKRLGGKASLELGNFNARRGEFAIDLPVNSLLSLRAAVGANKRDSYLLGGGGVGLEDQDDMAARLHALFTFSPATSLLLTAEYSKVNANGFTPVPLRAFFDGTQKGGNPTWPNDLLSPVYVDRGSDIQRTVDPYYAKATFRKNENNGFRAEANHSFGDVALTYQLGYLKSAVSASSIGPFNGFPFLGDAKAGESTQTTHELRLNSTQPGRLSWVAGMFLMNEDISRDTQYNTFINPNFTFQLKFQPTVENRSQAVFGQTTFALSDALRLVTGLRFSKDKKSARDAFGGGGLTIPAAPFDRSETFSKTTWKLGLDWDVTKEHFAYGSLSAGYKAGGFNADAVTAPYKPEDLLSLEFGLKSRLMDNRLQLGASAFAYDYRNLQLTSTVCTDPNLPSACNSKTVNAAKARILGLELEAKWRLSASGTLDVATALNRSRFGIYQPINRPISAPTVVVDWTGQRLDRSPSTTARVGYAHLFDLASGATIEAAASLRYNSGYLLSSYGTDYGTRYVQPAFTKADARLTWRSADDKYSVQAFVKNITDEITVETRLPGALNVGEPRTFGVRVGATF